MAMIRVAIPTTLRAIRLLAMPMVLLPPPLHGTLPLPLPLFHPLPPPLPSSVCRVQWPSARPLYGPERSPSSHATHTPSGRPLSIASLLSSWSLLGPYRHPCWLLCYLVGVLGVCWSHSQRLLDMMPYTAQRVEQLWSLMPMVVGVGVVVLLLVAVVRMVLCSCYLIELACHRLLFVDRQRQPCGR